MKFKLGVKSWKALKITHILSDIMWIGGVMALVSLLLGIHPSSPDEMLMAAKNHYVIDTFFLIPGGVAIVITSLCYSLLTPWGIHEVPLSERQVDTHHCADVDRESVYGRDIGEECAGCPRYCRHGSNERAVLSKYPRCCYSRLHTINRFQLYRDHIGAQTMDILEARSHNAISIKTQKPLCI